MAKILLVDDAKDSHLLLNAAFADKHHVSSAINLAEAREHLAAENFDLILLDVNLPDGSGFEFCVGLEVPVIFLTGKSDLSSKTIGFSLGAEDYIVKPFDAKEVLLRCEARIQKLSVQKKKDTNFTLGTLRFEILNQNAYLTIGQKSSALPLSPTGFKMLLYMAQHEDRVFTRDQIISAVWGHDTHVGDRTVDTHIASIRKLVEVEGSHIEIKTLYGQGYKLVFDVHALKSKIAS